MPLSGVKNYMKNLLRILDGAHSKGIIHRDIKPPNILYSPEEDKMTIIDWGLSEFYSPKKAMSPKVAARYFKAPELLMDNEFYNYSIDIWAAGMILASLVKLLDI